MLTGVHDNSVVFQYSFGKQSNVLGDIEEASKLRHNLTHLLRGVKISKHFPLLPRLMKVLPPSVAHLIAPEGTKNMNNLVQVSNFLSWH